MEGLTLPCGIGFKWPRMALPCQCLVFNVLSVLVVVAKLLTEAKGAGSTQQARSLQLIPLQHAVQYSTDAHKHTAESHELPCQLQLTQPFTAPLHSGYPLFFYPLFCSVYLNDPPLK